MKAFKLIPYYWLAYRELHRHKDTNSEKQLKINGVWGEKCLRERVRLQPTLLFCVFAAVDVLSPSWGAISLNGQINPIIQSELKWRCCLQVPWFFLSVVPGCVWRRRNWLRRHTVPRQSGASAQFVFPAVKEEATTVQRKAGFRSNVPNITRLVLCSDEELLDWRSQNKPQ